ncbi:MAG: hypothetical protein GX025_09530 [Clostridiales bacterium]|jgi:hypothetical protein|nr:hypothetical protein [Clostridiales bacterium]
MTKRIYMLIAVAASIFMLAGCQSSQLLSYSGAPIESRDEKEAPEETEETSAPESEAPEVLPSQEAEGEYSDAYNAYPRRETMMTVDGMNINWDELFYWYIYDVSNLEAYFGEITDWDAPCGLDNSMTNREYVMQNAIDTIKQYSSLQIKAKDMGIKLNEVDKVMLEANWQQNVINYGNGDEQAFIDYMATVYLSKAVYNKVNEVSALYQRVFEEMYGLEGEKLDQQTISEQGNKLGYMRAKHILLSTVDYTNTKLPAKQIAAKKARAEAILSELSAIKDPLEREARMNQLIISDGEDPGTAYYTDGYTFLSGRMTETFEKTVQRLGEYELSTIVETEYGYHIIMRLPLAADTVVEQLSQTEFWTLRQIIAQEEFTTLTEGWAGEVEIEFTEAYNNMDLAAVFSKAKASDNGNGSDR